MVRRTMILLCIPIVILILVVPLVFAGNRSGGGTATAGAGKGDVQTDQLRLREEKQLMDQEYEDDALQTRERTRERLQEYEKEYVSHYTAQDGKIYEWKRKYTKQAQKYEENKDPQVLHRYLYRVAHRYRFQYEQDIDGFVQWAKKYKPWNSH